LNNFISQITEQLCTQFTTKWQSLARKIEKFLSQKFELFNFRVLLILQFLFHLTQNFYTNSSPTDYFWLSKRQWQQCYDDA
jgi:hypothetical protein